MKKPLTRLMLALALAAVLARAAIPSGYMPNFGGDSFQMVICTLEGSKKVTLDENFNPIDEPHAEKETPCEFSLVKNLSLNAPIAALFAFALTLLGVAFAVTRSQIARRALRLPHLQSRAPPLST